jgi:type I restriction enzyme S subunit
MISKSLPSGWEHSKIGEIITPSIEKSDPSEYSGSIYVGLEHIEKDTGKVLGFGIPDDVKSTKSKFHEGDLLYGKLRPYLNKVWLADRGGICSTDILVLSKNDNISNKFLLYRLLCRDFVLFSNQLVSGIELPRVNFTKIAPFHIDLPPLPEQHRIVTKIEELFTQLDAGVASIRKVQAQLKLYQEAILKAAFEGRLTHEWREQNKGEIESASILLNRIIPLHAPDAIKNPSLSRSSDTSELPKLPEEWMWTTLESMALKITDGEHFSPKGEITGIPFLSAKDVRDNKLSFENPIYVNDDDAIRYRKRCNPEKEDILVVSRGATVGRCCKIETDRPFCLLGSVILIKVKKQLSSDYLLYALKSQVVHKQLINISGSTAQQAIYLRDIKRSFIPLCSQSEMKEIVAEIERHFSQIDHLENTIETSLRQAETLRHSILKRAFEGKLVPQDPKDEPASVLLERIKAENAHHTAELKKGKNIQSPTPKRKIKNAN